MDKKNYSAPALDKGLDILELLAVSASGLTQAEIAEHLNKSVNEIYRMLNTLKVRNYLEFDSSTDSYKLSFRQHDYEDLLSKLKLLNDNNFLKEVGSENKEYISTYLNEVELQDRFKKFLK